MINAMQMSSFTDELTRIVTGKMKLANLSGVQNQNQVPTQAAPPPTALGSVKVKSPPKGGTLGGSKPTYSKVNTFPTSSPAAGQQSLASPPSVKT
jgi:hypothetical protein